METQLILGGRATDHIWAMEHEQDGETLIGLRVDCGDSGTLYLTKDQAAEVIDTLQDMLREDKGPLQAWLKRADEALYEAWKLSEVDGNTLREINAAQAKIHALINANVTG